MNLLLLIVLIVLIAGGFPTMPLHQHYGNYPLGLGTVLLVVLVILLLTGRL